MIRRLLNGLAALLLLALGLLGLPAFLTGAYRALDTQMPDLADLPSVLLAPGDGGLFLLLLFAVGWLCWAVFTTAFAAEVMGFLLDETRVPLARSMTWTRLDTSRGQVLVRARG